MPPTFISRRQRIGRQDIGSRKRKRSPTLETSQLESAFKRFRGEKREELVDERPVEIASRGIFARYAEQARLQRMQ